MGTLRRQQRYTDLTLDDCADDVVRLGSDSPWLEYAHAPVAAPPWSRYTERPLEAPPAELRVLHCDSDQGHLGGWVRPDTWSLGGTLLQVRLLNPRECDVPTPTAAGLFKGFLVEGWIDRAVRERERARWFWLRASAAGLALRLWVPVGRGGPEKTFDLLRTLSDTPITRARAWVASLGNGDLDQLESESSAVARGLQKEIPLLEDAFSEGEGLEWLTARILTRRDDLESVLHCLRHRGRGHGLEDALLEVDETAAVHALALGSDPEREANPRLLGVATLEPQAWWGAMTRSS